jgi:PHD-zinc-finger like domain
MNHTNLKSENSMRSKKCNKKNEVLITGSDNIVLKLNLAINQKKKHKLIRRKETKKCRINKELDNKKKRTYDMTNRLRKMKRDNLMKMQHKTNFIKPKFKSDNLECEICLNSSSDGYDIIIECISCKSSCHKTCYGSDLINNNEIGKIIEFICLRCQELNKLNYNNSNIFSDMKSFYTKYRCIYCPSNNGLTKKIQNKYWAHVVCVNWIPNTNFIDE